jgi:hypothetical protein
LTKNVSTTGSLRTRPGVCAVHDGGIILVREKQGDEHGHIRIVKIGLSATTASSVLLATCKPPERHCASMDSGEAVFANVDGRALLDRGALC